MIIKYFSLTEKPKRAIIALHGWTGNASSMEPIAKFFNFPDTKWLFPQAPYKINNSTNLNSNKFSNGYSWSNHTVRDNNTPKKSYVEKSIKVLRKCIKFLENNGFNKNKIFILGFSQGAIFSLWFIINQKFSMGGCISISGGFDKSKQFMRNNLQSESKLTRILLLHGENDKIIIPDDSKNTYKLFKDFGFDIKLKLYPTAHRIPLKAKKIIWNFLIKND